MCTYMYIVHACVFKVNLALLDSSLDLAFVFVQSYVICLFAKISPPGAEFSLNPPPTRPPIHQARIG